MHTHSTRSEIRIWEVDRNSIPAMNAFNYRHSFVSLENPDINFWPPCFSLMLFGLLVLLLASFGERSPG